MTDVIISSHVCNHKLLPPTAHLPSVSPQDTASSSHVPQRWINSQWRSVFIWLSHRRLYAPLCFHICFLHISASAFVLRRSICQPESHQHSKKLTELHVWGVWAVLLWVFGAQPHVIMCMWAGNCLEPQSQLRVSNRKVTCKDSIAEFLARANLAMIRHRGLLYCPRSIRLHARDSQSHNQNKKEIKNWHYINQMKYSWSHEEFIYLIWSKHSSVSTHMQARGHGFVTSQSSDHSDF